MHKELPFSRDQMPDRRIDGILVDGRFLKGLELFNLGEYYDSHEVIEDLWLETPSESPLRDLYKGVIQAAAAVYQYDRGIVSGAKGLYRTSIGYLASYRPRALGLDVEALIEAMKDFFKELETWDGATEISCPDVSQIKASYGPSGEVA